MTSSSSYGITERASGAGDAQRHAEQIRLLGYTVIDSGISPAAISDLGSRLDALLQSQAREAGGFDRLARIGDQETARCCLAFDDAFLALATNPHVMAVSRELLGDHFLLMQQNGIVNTPGREHTQSAHHRDLPYQHFTSSRPLGISALFCIDEFTVENGATVLLPASHKVEQFPSETVVSALEVPIEARSGSYIVFDSMLFHRAGSNRSSGPRRAVNQVYTLPFIAQQFSLPRILGGRHSDDPQLARLLGYDSGPLGSLAEWWQRRQTRIVRA